jgi:uncharacterized membrane protein YjgN (DUF898 family)
MLDPVGSAGVQNASSALPQHRFSFHGTGGAFFAIVLKNIVLTILTLGIYAPWAKTVRRQFLWQNTEVAGHRLRYHGTGQELLVGYVKVAIGYALLVGLPLALTKLVSPTAGTIAQFATLAVIVPLIPFAIWGSRRYLLSRTSWRGIRLRLDGSAGPYAKVFFLGYLLTIITIGVYGPIWLNRLHRISLDASGIGTKKFEYKGDDKEVWKIGLKGMALTLLTCGFYYPWYLADLNRYQMANTWFDGAHGELSMTGSDVFQLLVLQIFGVSMTMGLAFPWITTYSLQLTMARLRFIGPIDFAHIYQANSEGSATADGLADALDVGVL